MGRSPCAYAPSALPLPWPHWALHPFYRSRGGPVRAPRARPLVTFRADGLEYRAMIFRSALPQKPESSPVRNLP